MQSDADFGVGFQLIGIDPDKGNGGVSGSGGDDDRAFLGELIFAFLEDDAEAGQFFLGDLFFVGEETGGAEIAAQHAGQKFVCLHQRIDGSGEVFGVEDNTVPPQFLRALGEEFRRDNDAAELP